jgi:hypothetical protein
MDSGTWTVACVVQHLRNMVGTGSSYGAQGRIAGFKLRGRPKTAARAETPTSWGLILGIQTVILLATKQESLLLRRGAIDLLACSLRT